jgi:hypothetical protein
VANAIGTMAGQRVPMGSANRPVIRRVLSHPSLSFVARLRGASKLRAHRVGRTPKKDRAMAKQELLQFDGPVAGGDQ